MIVDKYAHLLKEYELIVLAEAELKQAKDKLESRATRAEGSRVPDQTDEQLAHMTANYYGMISQIDHNVGRILEALEQRGLDGNTLIVYTTDHGELLGNHGLQGGLLFPNGHFLNRHLGVQRPPAQSQQLGPEPRRDRLRFVQESAGGEGHRAQEAGDDNETRPARS